MTSALGLEAGALAQAVAGKLNTLRALAVTQGASLETLNSTKVVAIGDYANHAAAIASGKQLYVPADYASPLANAASLTTPHWGPGRLTLADGNKRGKWFSNVASAPTAFGTHDSIDTAFNGDLSHSIFQVEHRITGATTLGQPTSGYTYTPEAMPFYGVLFNSSGWNQQAGGNDGRTGTAFFRVSVQQYGQGDSACFNGTGFVTGTRAGSTHFLANPAVSLFNGDVSSGANYTYLNPREIGLSDDGFDVAGMGDVANFYRTNETGGQSCFWAGYRIQSLGTKPINAGLSVVGKVNNVIDTAMATTDLGTNQAIISGKAGQRIYLNNYSTNGNYTDGFNGDYLEYNTGLAAVQFIAGGTSVLQIKTAQVTVNSAKLVANGQVGFSGLNTFADNAAAVAGGLGAKDLWIDASGFVRARL